MIKSLPVNCLGPHRKMLRALKNSLVVFLLLALVCGVFYPVLVTGAGQLLFPWRAGGSLLYIDGKPVGSELIGQDWTRPEYFHGRPSANEGGANNAMTSGGSNAGPRSVALTSSVKVRVREERAANPAEKGPVPQVLVTASGSGLDPHITPEAARWQASRIAAARGIDRDEVLYLVRQMTDRSVLHFLGERRVNVLLINIELDRQHPMPIE